MNIKLGYLWGLIALLQLSYVQASEPFEQVQDMPVTLQARIDELSSEISILQQEVESCDLSVVTADDRERFMLILNSLQAELARLDTQIGTSRVVGISDDVLASRGGPAFIPKSADRPEPTPLFSLSNDLSEDAGLYISGFMDAVYETNSRAEHGNNAYLNQVEVDLAKDINARTAASLGIIYDETFQVGVAQISYKLKPESESSYSALKSWTAFAGQFDAPFGEDVQCYASNSRKTITTPDIVESTHGCWNDIGVASNWSFKNLSVDAWTVRGFSLRSNVDVEDAVDVLNASGGTRVNLNMSSNVRCGGSYAIGWLKNGSPAMHLYGAHAVFLPGTWSFSAEGIVLKEAIGGVDLNHQGCYVQGIKELGRFFALSRMDYLEGSDFEGHKHLSLGAGAYLGSGLEFRSEFRFDSESNNHQGFAQVVATF